MLLKSRFLPVGALAAAAATLFTAGAAHAAPTAALTGGCSVPQTNQVFLPWGDQAEYFLAPAGNFADSGASWSLSGGATVVAGGDGYSLAGSPASTQSLSLPDGSSATSPGFCVNANDPSFRFFAKNTGSSNGTLQVNATVTNSLGSTTVTVANISAGDSWSPTAATPLIENALGVVPGGTSDITLSFVAYGGQWQIDDLYIDPFRCC